MCRTAGRAPARLTGLQGLPHPKPARQFGRQADRNHLCACPPPKAGVKYCSFCQKRMSLSSCCSMYWGANGTLSGDRLPRPSRPVAHVEFCHLRPRGLARDTFRPAVPTTPRLERSGPRTPHRNRPRFGSSRSRLHGGPPTVIPRALTDRKCPFFKPRLIPPRQASLTKERQTVTHPATPRHHEFPVDIPARSSTVVTSSGP